MKKLKQFISLMVVAVLIISLVGCANTSKVKEQLCGPWGYEVESINGKCYQFYIFSSDNTYQSVWENVNAPSKNSESKGEYKIEKDKIILTKDDGNLDSVIEYSFEDDKLTLIDKHSDNSGNRELIYIEN